MKNIVMLIVGVALIAAMVALSYHQWSDCLEENSFFTCVRMLNK